MPGPVGHGPLVAELLVLTEHYCDLGRLFPHVRALREQVDWPALRRAVDRSPFARAFLGLCEELDLSAGPRPAEASARDLTSRRAERARRAGAHAVDEQGVDRGGDARGARVGAGAGALPAEEQRPGVVAATRRGPSSGPRGSCAVPITSVGGSAGAGVGRRAWPVAGGQGPQASRRCAIVAPNSG